MRRHRALAGALLVGLALLGGCAAGGKVAAEGSSLPGAPPGSDDRVEATAAGTYLAARHAERTFDLPKAADLLGQTVSIDGENVRLKEHLLLLLLNAGEIDKAAPVAEAVLAQGPQPIARLAVAVEALHRKDWKDASAQLEQLGQPSLFALLHTVGLAWAKFGGGDVDGGLSLLEGLGDRKETLGLKHLMRALMFDLADRSKDAEASYTNLISDSGPTLRAAQLAGNFFERHGDPARARTVYEAFLHTMPAAQQMVPETPPEHPARLVGDARGGFAEALLSLAAAANAQRQGASLGLMLSRFALYLAPDNAMAKLLTAEIVENERRYDTAIRLLSSVGPSDTLYLAAQLRLAADLDVDDRTDEAITGLKALAERFPKRPEPYQTLGDILRGRERYAEAVDAYDAAFERLGEAGPSQWRMLYARGIALERTRNWDRAERDFKAALALEPNQASVLNYLGYSWLDRGMHIKEAEELIRKAVEFKPDDGFIVDSLGWVYYRTGRYDQAVDELEKAVILEPGDPTINEHLGDAYWRVGRQAEARFQWKQALKLDPDKERIDSLEEKVRCGLNGCGKPKPAAR